MRERYRLRAIFEVIWDIDESLKTYVTPKVIIQPLVENAIFHGVSGMDGEGTIWIRIKRAEDEVQIIVEDNGFVPIDMERLNGILSGEATDKGYGIRNVHQRIQLHFDEVSQFRKQCDEDGSVDLMNELLGRFGNTVLYAALYDHTGESFKCMVYYCKRLIGAYNLYGQLIEQGTV